MKIRAVVMSFYPCTFPFQIMPELSNILYKVTDAGWKMQKLTLTLICQRVCVCVYIIVSECKHTQP